MVREYINNILVITKHDFADRLKALENFPQKIMEALSKVNE